MATGAPVGRELVRGQSIRRAGAAALIVAGVIAAAPGSSALATTFTVNSTADPGNGACNGSQCTLREGIEAANARAGKDVVRFKAGKGRRTIALASELPAITEEARLDGWTQPGFKRKPLIELDGSGAGAGASGLTLADATGATITIRGFVVNRFDVFGIDVGGSGLSAKAKILGVYVGTDVAGSRDRGNGSHGVLVRELAGVTIGGGKRKQRVVISGNGGDGVRLSQVDTGGFPSSIVGTRIGTNAKGTAAIPNTGDGIHWTSAWGARIGGPASDGSDLNNLISGNSGAGIALSGNCLPICGQQNVIDGNFVGANAAGDAALPNADQGILLEGAGGTKIGDSVGNLISGNGSDGIYAQDVAGATIEGNAIGTNGTVSGVVPNEGNGINLEPSLGQIRVGGFANSDSNVIGGNLANGIRVGGSNVEIYNNLVGTYPTAGDLGNSGYGVLLDGDALVGGTGAFQKGNVIAFNGAAGIGASTGISGISANSIHDNAGLGIDLGNDGATANDALDPDGGPNFLQNRPDITSVISTGFSTEVTVELDSVAGSPTHPFGIELFSNPAGTCDASGGEGAAYLGSAPLNTDGTGHGSANLSLGPLAAGTELAATATDTSDSAPWTSEFSACYAVPSS